MTKLPPNLRAFPGGGTPAHEAAGELAEKIKTLVYEHADRMPAATAIGVLVIVLAEIMADHS